MAAGPMEARRVAAIRLARFFTCAIAWFVLCACSSTPRAAIPAPPETPATVASQGAPKPDPEALDALDRAERTLAAAAGDCSAACGALAEIADARARLCSPRTDACADAERREVDARRTVTTTCGACEGGS
jgi:hypothetical protein